MLRNYLKLAWRNLLRNRTSSLINIGGLAAGMAVAILIGLWIRDELSFDTYHANYDRIGQLKTHNGTDLNSTYDYLPLPLADAVRTTYASDFDAVVLSSGSDDHILSAGDKKFTQSGAYMQPAAPDMLTLHMREGSRRGLSDPHSILLSGGAAERLFGQESALGKTVTIDNTSTVTVTGVYDDLPDNSSFYNTTFIAPWDLLVSTNNFVKGDLGNWNDNSFHIYVLLSPHTSFATASAHIRNIEYPHLDAGRRANDPAIFVHPMSHWHLHNYFEHRVEVTSEAMKFVWFYGCIGVFVLLLACINFMNLSTARSEKRAKEVGIRKTIGSGRPALVRQFLSESVLLASLAWLAALVLVQLILPWFDEVSGKKIPMPWSDPWFWAAGAVFVLFTGVAAGSYPALYLSSFRPIRVLRNRSSSLPRKVLVVFQFTISIALVIGTLIVYHQVQYARNRPVGYDRQGLLQLPMTTPDFNGIFDRLSTELDATGVVSNVAESSLPVTSTWSNTGGVTWKGMDPNMDVDFAVVRVSPEYGKTVGFQLVEGRDFSRSFPTDSTGFIINETAARYMGLTRATGTTVHWSIPDDHFDKNFHIIGVVKDMVMNSPFQKVKQTLYWMGGAPSWITLRIRPDVPAGVALPKIAAVFKHLVPSAPFDYDFTDEAYAAKFQAEERVGKLAAFFALLAVLISCLGLFGLASYTAEQRTKEIGIRKVLGASVVRLWGLLTGDFVKLVVISCLVAVPLSTYFMRTWLAQYDYRVSVSWWILGLAAGGALMVTVCTVSFQAIRAALANPVKSLKTE
ncbi:ABC-type antimicrobial peptide transport system permease subunit [Dinghuibacter silviterrae]|uniref:ABC-type antimicrobial peptide transport system permease subunit n=2 Tax=Dinghuibacter silviterrae TaxID=1539049 RepID=A0A4V3GLN1_9BACT|nr:ABC-type antimicrobial peptide transport system permease subunit [Dinghuibacter silviterrae]